MQMAYRMQTSVPELTDLSDETAATLEMYGPDVKQPGTFANNCLIAQQLVSGVGMVQLMHAGWDQHNSVTTELYTQCRDTDQASAALVKDLKARIARRHAGDLGRRVWPRAVHSRRY